MPLTFEQAKLQVNPDPIWQPTRDSPEYFEILTVMRHSGVVFPDGKPKPKVPLTIRDVYREGRFKAPIDNSKPPVINKPVSKKEFLSVPCNKKLFEECLAKHRLNNNK
jgi:hypothetical protein